MTMIAIFLIIIGGIGIGWLANGYLNSNKQIPTVAKFNVLGLYMPYEQNWSEAMNNAFEHDANGDWICINLKGQNYNDTIETIKHEVGHEIFARYCSKDNNIDKCMNLTQ